MTRVILKGIFGCWRTHTHTHTHTTHTHTHTHTHTTNTRILHTTEHNEQHVGDQNLDCNKLRPITSTNFCFLSLSSGRRLLRTVPCLLYPRRTRNKSWFNWRVRFTPSLLSDSTSRDSPCSAKFAKCTWLCVCECEGECGGRTSIEANGLP